jgi:hypothetical protein
VIEPPRHFFREFRRSCRPSRLETTATGGFPANAGGLAPNPRRQDNSLRRAADARPGFAAATRTYHRQVTEMHAGQARGAWRRAASVTALFAGLTAVMTWPQVLVFGTHAAEHQDVYFNMWRLRWHAHALANSTADLFNGNIFYPEQGVLAYSDALLVQGWLAAPLLWAGAPPVLVHNLMLLGAIVASAVGICVLTRHLTGSMAGGVVAGIVFAFAPYRFDHYMHMELQWTVWVPWAFWALQRTIETGAPRFGVLTGAFVALQVGSSIYYGVFLLILIAAVAALQLLPLRGARLRHGAAALCLGGALAGLASWGYSRPYAAASERVGERSIQEVETFSARPRDYRRATPTNRLYGSDVGRPERRLSPGVVAPLLAVVGLLLAPTPVAVCYLLGLVLAFELSLGAYGMLYPFLYEHVSVFRGLRAPARAAVFCLFFLGVLTGHLTAALTQVARIVWRPVIGALVCLAILFEYRTAPLELVAYPNDPPPLHQFLSHLPPGVVAEFPMPEPDAPPHHDARYAYMSTFHWLPLVNGYSGFYPRSYSLRLIRMQKFPDATTLTSLKGEDVRYVVIHDDGQAEGERERTVERLLALGAKRLADFDDGWGMATVLELQ